MGGTMDLFRSEEMQLMQLMMPAEIAHDIVAELGEVGMLQFKDLNPDKSAFQRTYANQVKRTDEMARKLRFSKDQVEKAGLIVGQSGSGIAMDLDELETKLEETESELLEMNANSERLRRSHAELLELQLVLEKAGSFFEDAQSTASHRRFDGSSSGIESGGEIGAPLLAESAAEPKTVRLGFVAGVIQQEKLTPFERLLFRATRGNMFLKQSPVGKVLDPTTGEKQEKSVFVVFFAGERARVKILKICEAFGANRYPFPEDQARQRQMNAEVTARLRELHTTIEAGDRHRDALLSSLGANLDGWITQVRREKAIYHTLNKFSVDYTRKVLVAEAWCPVAGKDAVYNALRRVEEKSRTTVSTILQPLVTYEMPPTYFRTGKITGCFQDIVDAYGIAKYREANPAIFTVVTFPFLFAVMFGDIGHGIIMLMFALYLVLNEKKLGKTTLNEMVEMCFGGRYCILFMALFSIYVGFIYNEMFSVPTSFFGSTRFECAEIGGYDNPVDMKFDPEKCRSAFGNGLVMKKDGQPYPFGVDPVWHGTRTELTFLNSLKMKMSIILGIIQMNGGIILSFFNHRYFRDSLSMWCEFVPQMIFLNGLFGYLVILIISKWASHSVVDLYHVMIYMFLGPGDVDCGGECPENKMYNGQAAFQVFLLLLAFVAVPWMLLPKPLILRKRHMGGGAAAGQNANYGLVSHDEDDEERQTLTTANSHLGGGEHGGGGGHGGHGEHFDFGEIMIHQMIHTIEFVLGAVSNTASYLRLWALSLAHSQLSAVFYDRVLIYCVRDLKSIPLLVVGFFVFTFATLGVLLGMESLSAFLHALRLHWVEFQNKFYHGDGYKFAPFAFRAIDKEEL